MMNKNLLRSIFSPQVPYLESLVERQYVHGESITNRRQPGLGGRREDIIPGHITR